MLNGQARTNWGQCFFFFFFVRGVRCLQDYSYVFHKLEFPAYWACFGEPCRSVKYCACNFLLWEYTTIVADGIRLYLVVFRSQCKTVLIVAEIKCVLTTLLVVITVSSKVTVFLLIWLATSNAIEHESWVRVSFSRNNNCFQRWLTVI